MNTHIEHAIELACRAHTGQVDKTGQPYILHPLRVMLCFENYHDRVVAVLHDVLEDAPSFLTEIESFVDLDCVESLFMLTRLPNEPYSVYIDRVCLNDRARRIKIADLDDNLRPERINKLDQTTRNRLKLKYETAIIQLCSRGDQREK